MILYLISGRGFSKNNVGRKMFEVINCFKDVVETDVLFGGDIPVERKSSTPISKSEYYSKWYRKSKVMLFFSESYAEIKSLMHNFQTYKYIKKNKKDYSLVWGKK